MCKLPLKVEPHNVPSSTLWDQWVWLYSGKMMGFIWTFSNFILIVTSVLFFFWDVIHHCTFVTYMWFSKSLNLDYFLSKYDRTLVLWYFVCEDKCKSVFSWTYVKAVDVIYWLFWLDWYKEQKFDTYFGYLTGFKSSLTDKTEPMVIVQVNYFLIDRVQVIY